MIHFLPFLPFLPKCVEGFFHTAHFPLLPLAPLDNKHTLSSLLDTLTRTHSHTNSHTLSLAPLNPPSTQPTHPLFQTSLPLCIRGGLQSNPPLVSPVPPSLVLSLPCLAWLLACAWYSSVGHSLSQHCRPETVHSTKSTGHLKPLTSLPPLLTLRPLVTCLSRLLALLALVSSSVN